MEFRNPTQEEIREYSKYISRNGLVMQSLVALFFIAVAIFILCMEGELFAKAVAAIVILLFDTKWIGNVVDIYQTNKNYKQGNYEVCKIAIDRKKRGSRRIGGGSSMPIHIDTYKIEEIGEEVVVLGGNPQQVINEQHAMLIKMIRRRKNIYYITHIV